MGGLDCGAEVAVAQKHHLQVNVYSISRMHLLDVGSTDILCAGV